MSHPSSPVSRGWLRPLLRGAFAVGLLCGLVWLGASRWDQVPREALTPNWLVLAFALVAFLGTGVFAIALWRVILGALGIQLSFPLAFCIHVLASLGRYVPGKIWGFAGQVYLAKRAHLAPATVVAASVYATGLTVMSGGLWAITLLPSFSGVQLPGGWGGILGLTGVCVLALHPRPLSMLLRLAARLLRVETEIPLLSFPGLVALCGGYAACWVAGGLSFFLFARGLTPLPVSAVLPVSGAVVVASTAGYLALFAPAGIGVREGVLVVLLSSHLQVPVAVAVALSYRVFGLVGQAVQAAAAFTLVRGAIRGAVAHSESVENSTGESGVRAWYSADSKVVPETE